MILAPGLTTLLRWLSLGTLAFSSPAFGRTLPLDKLNLPDGFEIAVWAEVDNPRQLAISPDGVVFSGSRGAGNVYALIDTNADQFAETVIMVDSGLSMPTGVAYHDGDLYVGAINNLLTYRNINMSLDAPPAPETIYDDLPKNTHHGWKFIDFGPDDQLYFNVGAPCNICLKSDERFASIMRLDPSKPDPQVYAHGVRNSVGFTWHPKSGELWFTDNGRDYLGDKLPPCELNVADKQGLHFGYPYIHGKNIADPKFGDKRGSQIYIPPVLELGAHVAPLGLAFYQGDMFPKNLYEQLLIAEHGSWNRSTEAGHVGYRIILAKNDGRGNIVHETFIDGWLQDNVAWGRPVDILELEDGSLLISDDTANVIYRLIYSIGQ